MLILVDEKIPSEAKDNLKHYGKLIEISTKNIVYPAISGHPDIFFCSINKTLITAPNLPDRLVKALPDDRIIPGKGNPGASYPASARYNAVATEKYFIHNLSITDQTLSESAHSLIRINVSQGYTRCNLLPLPGNRFITSDQGINKNLSKQGIEILYVPPEEILLPSFDHGFFGGACGIFENKVFILGNLKYYSEGHKVREYIETADCEVIELCQGPLFDGGSIIFLD